MTEPLKLKAYGKVNLGLDVLRRRDDGYHEVKMIMQTVKLYDQITMCKNNTGNIHLTTSLPYLPTNEKNLVYRAIDMIRTNYGIKEGVDADIDKHIPVAAGMAGGSTDAAAALVGMNQIFSLGISQEKLMEYGAQLGADVPFCIMRGTALSEGIGEILSPLPPIPNCWFVIIKPVFSMSTKFVYQHLTLDDATIHPDIDGMVKALYQKDLTGVTSRLGNVLEQVTAEHYPAIHQIKNVLMEMDALGALMSGSGSTVFGIFTDKQAAYRASHCLGARSDIRQTAVVRPFNKKLYTNTRKRGMKHES